MGVFDPITINGMRVKNRFVRSATWEAERYAAAAVALRPTPRDTGFTDRW